MKIFRCIALAAGIMVAVSFFAVPSGFSQEESLSVEQVFLEMLTRKKVLEQIRKEWPQYEDLSDDRLAREFYSKAKEDSAVKARLERMILEDKERDERKVKAQEARVEKKRKALLSQWDVSDWQDELDEIGRFQGFQCAEGLIIVLDTKQGHLWSYADPGELEYIGQIAPGEPIRWPK
jgi:DNA repair exonuclease SbcCD nuclease subunit